MCASMRVVPRVYKLVPVMDSLPGLYLFSRFCVEVDGNPPVGDRVIHGAPTVGIAMT